MTLLGIGAVCLKTFLGLLTVFFLFINIFINFGLKF